MLLNDLIVFPDVISFEFDDLVDESLRNSRTKIIILGLLIKRNRH